MNTCIDPTRTETHDNASKRHARHTPAHKVLAYDSGKNITPFEVNINTPPLPGIVPDELRDGFVGPEKAGDRSRDKLQKSALSEKWVLFGYEVSGKDGLCEIVNVAIKGEPMLKVVCGQMLRTDSSIEHLKLEEKNDEGTPKEG